MKLTDEEKRVKLAEALGWKLVPRLFHNHQWKDIPTWVERRLYDGKPDDYTCAGQAIGAMPPNYFGSLEAMHEAEKVLTDPHARSMYAEYLRRECNPSTDRLAKEWTWEEIDRAMMATARQRGECLGIALNLWQP